MKKLLLVSLIVFLCASLPAQVIVNDNFSVTTEIINGESIDQCVINGPSTPPPNYEDISIHTSGVPPYDALTLAVPATDWCFGCSATSAAMIAGYYDRNGYPNMYVGPTNGGIFPMNNDPWPDWVDAALAIRHQNPLSATHMGLDGRATAGHVDDYWIQADAPGPDPWVSGGTEHTYGHCTGDYMKTNQWVNPGEGFNVDGSTVFNNFTDGSPTYDTDLEGYGLDIYDGGYGWKLFYQSRGYTVPDGAMFNQYIQGYKDPTNGFTFDMYRAMIDKRIPVLIHVEGHTMVGMGYQASTQKVFLHNTWDTSTGTTNEMVWGTSYAGMAHYGVTVIDLPQPLLVINGVIDGPLTGGNPKAVELYVVDAIADLSEYGLGSANDGGGTDGQEFTFPAVGANAGDFIWVASEATQFTNWFGDPPDYTSGALAIDGDDAIELFWNGNVVDVFGEINSTPGAWDYEDGWAHRNCPSGPDGSTFVLGNWAFSGINALDGETTNGTAATPYPDGEAPLPVELAYFIAEMQKATILLKWLTESEIENLGFIIEKRTGDTDWVTIASYKSHPDLMGQGSTSNQTEYQFIDHAVKDGVTYEYRLADVDYEGIVNYNSTRVITAEMDKSLITRHNQLRLHSVFPNPFNSIINIEYELINSEKVNINIYDINGKLVTTLLDEQQDSGWHNVRWNGLDKYGNEVPGGVYISKISSGSDVETFKIMYLK